MIWSPVMSLTDVEARLLWEPYRWGRRDLDPLLVRMNGDLGEILTLRREDLLRDRDWYINPLVGDYFGGAGTGDAEVQRRVDALSPRERQALALLSSGMSEREISCFMGISNHTLHGYVKTLYRLFQANSRPELLVQIGDLRVPIE